MIFPHVVPTPVLAWNIVGVGAAAGVVVTASHNPPADNGYKVFLADGRADRLAGRRRDRGVHRCGRSVRRALSAARRPADRVARRLVRAGLPRCRAGGAAASRTLAGVPVAYSAMHGVGGGTLLAAFDRAGPPTPFVVAEQQQPDGTFPTVAFPEPGGAGRHGPAARCCADSRSRDRAVQRPRCRPARRSHPDTRRRLAPVEGRRDRLAARRPHPAPHRRATIGWSSRRSCRRRCWRRWRPAYGVHFAETYTGFKWIGHTVLDQPESRFVFGYEQALGIPRLPTGRSTRTASPPRCCWPKLLRSPRSRA